MPLHKLINKYFTEEGLVSKRGLVSIEFESFRGVINDDDGNNPTIVYGLITQDDVIEFWVMGERKIPRYFIHNHITSGRLEYFSNDEWHQAENNIRSSDEVLTFPKEFTGVWFEANAKQYKQLFEYFKEIYSPQKNFWNRENVLKIRNNPEILTSYPLYELRTLFPKREDSEQYFYSTKNSNLIIV